MKIKISALLLLFLLTIAPIANATTLSVTNQDVTGYVAATGATTYHGTTPTRYYTAAVHPKVSGDANSGTIFPFGAIITTTSALTLAPGHSRTTFRVEDMGDVNYTRGLTLWWFDVYFGVNNATNTSDALSFGKQKTDYSVTY
ncbi:MULTISPECIES: hypothetical protein [unclassified Cohnella]|uniref:hypothetical protein n=1 Tax=unclassified Cohnella TaxID=2636738 RepID=UPI001180A902|nr:MULTISPECIES: hypothetical protein [unclassified Cohnella]